jgi:hypothetical protein
LVKIHKIYQKNQIKAARVDRENILHTIANISTRQQSVGNRQQATGNRQQATGNRQQATGKF